MILNPLRLKLGLWKRARCKNVDRYANFATRAYFAFKLARQNTAAAGVIGMFAPHRHNVETAVTGKQHDFEFIT